MCYVSPHFDMFGLSFGELVVLIVVAIVVIGPRDLPKMLGKLGQFAGKMRRMASDLRHQSGIDEVLRAEGIQENLSEIRKLARGELDHITEAARVDARPFDPEPVAAAAAAAPAPYSPYSPHSPAGYPGGYGDEIHFSSLSEREYPREGADHGDALADTAFMYTTTFEPSPLARDPLYMTGDPNGVIPEPEPKEPAEPQEPAEPPTHETPPSP